MLHHRHLQPPPGGVEPPLRREPPVEHPVRGGVGQGDDVRGQVHVQAQRGDLELAAGGVPVVHRAPERDAGPVVQVAHPAGVVVAGQVHGLDLVAHVGQPARLALEPDRLGQRVLPDPAPGPVQAAADPGPERHLVPAEADAGDRRRGHHGAVGQLPGEPRGLVAVTQPGQGQPPRATQPGGVADQPGEHRVTGAQRHRGDVPHVVGMRPDRGYPALPLLVAQRDQRSSR